MKIAAAVILAYLLIALGPARGHWKPNTEHNRAHAITHAFCHSLKPCRLGNEALRVARCESGANLWHYASNGGAYLGMFQFGAWARARFGFSWSPWEQARAAYRYYSHRENGRKLGWSGWECKP